MYKIPLEFLTVGEVNAYWSTRSTLKHVFLEKEQMARSILSGSSFQLVRRYCYLNIIVTSDNEGDNEEPANIEACRRGQRRFTIQEKAAIIRTAERLMQQHGMTRYKVCEDLNITTGMHWAWKQKLDAMLEAKKNSIKAKCIHCGIDSCLTAHTQELLQFIFELRKQGMAVPVRMVALRTAQLSEQFHD